MAVPYMARVWIINMIFTRIKHFCSSTPTLTLLFSAGLLLNGCSGAKEQLGLERTVPDEFKVVKHAPLALPPGYNLRPPRPGAPRPQEQTPQELAEQTVLGRDSGSATVEQSSGENLLLQQARATRATSDIRRIVDQETLNQEGREKPVVQKLLGIGGGRDEIAATVVDAKAEAQRLRENAESGKPITEGESPSIED